MNIIELAREVADKDKVDPVHNEFVVLTPEELERFAAAVIAARDAELIAGVGEPVVRTDMHIDGYGVPAYSKAQVAGAVAKYKEALDCDSAILAARTKVMNQQAERIATLESTLRQVFERLGPIAPLCCGCFTEWQMALNLINEVLHAE